MTADTHPFSPQFSLIKSWHRQQQQMTLRSPAKVNLFLKILGKRPDGYHRLVSLMAKIDTFDEITLTQVEEPGVQLSCPGHPELEKADNLVYRAATAVLPKGVGVEIELIKNLPMGAGLGGGSGNAATTLYGLNELLGLELPLTAQLRLAAKWGADVPFFLQPETFAMATGTGTELRSLTKIPPLSLVVIHPPFGVPTAWAYQAYAALGQPTPKTLTLTNRNDKDFANSQHKPSNSSLLGCLARMMRNDLEAVVIAKYPQIAELKSSLIERGAMAALMSGSGSSVMGLFGSKEEAQTVAKELAARTGFWCHAVRTL